MNNNTVKCTRQMDDFFELVSSLADGKSKEELTKKAENLGMSKYDCSLAKDAIKKMGIPIPTYLLEIEDTSLVLMFKHLENLYYEYTPIDKGFSMTFCLETEKDSMANFRKDFLIKQNSGPEKANISIETSVISKDIFKAIVIRNN